MKISYNIIVSVYELIQDLHPFSVNFCDFLFKIQLKQR